MHNGESIEKESRTLLNDLAVKELKLIEYRNR